MMKKILIALVALSFASAAWAEVRSKEITYQDGDQQLKGYLAWDDAQKGKRPGIIVVHEWWGLNDYAKLRARKLAQEGYVAFAADMYGPGKVTMHAKDAQGWMTQITQNQEAWQKRALLGLEQLKASPNVDASKLAAIGYCFGGATVMQMAYAGADLDGVVSFHGSMPPATPEQAAAIKARVLIAHGDIDPFVPAERVIKFKNALSDANVDWEMDVYANTKHGFTNPDAGKFGMDQLAYNEKADKRSWQRMKDFFAEIF
jgi:dienelactone hydrolase